MSVNSGIPNQEGLSQQYIFTSVKPAGAPGPASAQTTALKVFTPGQASNGQQGHPTVETLAAAGLVIPVEQISGEVHTLDGEANEAAPIVYADIKSGVPVPGQAPNPAPTMKAGTGTASGGHQPAVTTPFTNAQWATKSAV